MITIKNNFMNLSNTQKPTSIATPNFTKILNNQNKNIETVPCYLNFYQEILNNIYFSYIELLLLQICKKNHSSEFGCYLSDWKLQTCN